MQCFGYKTPKIRTEYETTVQIWEYCPSTKGIVDTILVKKGCGYYLHQESCVFYLSEGKLVDTKEVVDTILVNKVCG